MGVPDEPQHSHFKFSQGSLYIGNDCPCLVHVELLIKKQHWAWMESDEPKALLSEHQLSFCISYMLLLVLLK